jgi:hypothetical protein
LFIPVSGRPALPTAADTRTEPRTVPPRIPPRCLPMFSPMKYSMLPLGLAIMASIVTARAEDEPEEHNIRPDSAKAQIVRDFACGSVVLRYEMCDGPGWHQSRYTIINPGAINYIPIGGTQGFIVEWNTNRRGELVTLNGWQCVPLGARP